MELSLFKELQLICSCAPPLRELQVGPCPVSLLAMAALLGSLKGQSSNVLFRLEAGGRTFSESAHAAVLSCVLRSPVKSGDVACHLWGFVLKSSHADDMVSVFRNWV